MVLSPGAPVTLSWDNGSGLTFRRTLAINDDYMITVDDSVESALASPLTLFPYGLVRRHGTPATTGIYILHEGALGVFDETLREEDYGDMQDAEDGVSEIRPETSGGYRLHRPWWLAALVLDQKAKMNFARPPGSPTAIRSIISPASRPFWRQAALHPARQGCSPVRRRSRFSTAMPKNLNALRSGDRFRLRSIDQALLLRHQLAERPLGNFGLAVLAFTIVALVFYPLANKSYRRWARCGFWRRRLRNPRTSFRGPHGDEPGDDALQGREGTRQPAVFPVPQSVFFVYKVPFVTIEMWHAPFFGWIIDLSALTRPRSSTRSG